MSDEPIRIGGRVLDMALALLLAAMALYGVVQILQAIWLWLCLLAAAAVLGGVAWLVIERRYSRW